MNAYIEKVAYFLPEKCETNDELGSENPKWDMKLVEEIAGVNQRYITDDDTTSLDLAEKACEKLFEKDETLKNEIDAILFCTESPDYILPPNATILHGRLRLKTEVLALDFNLACSGFIYGLILAEGLIASGAARKVLLVTAETYSKYINPRDRSSRILFSDGAAVTVISASVNNGIIDTIGETFGKGYDNLIIPAGGCRTPIGAATKKETVDKSGNTRTLEDIHMRGMGILTFVSSKVPRQIKGFLTKNDLTVDDIDVFIFHQASKLILNTLQRMLRIPPEKEYRNLHNIGNTVSASIPIALAQALEEDFIKPGDLILLSGFGVGLSYASALIRM